MLALQVKCVQRRTETFCFAHNLSGQHQLCILLLLQAMQKETRCADVGSSSDQQAFQDARHIIRGVSWLLQRGGYDVYILEVDHGSPQECHQRNIHNRSLADIEQAAAQWQDTPTMYPLLDVACLLGTNKKKGKQVKGN